MDATKLELLRRRSSDELAKMWEGHDTYPADTITALRTVLDERGLALPVAEDLTDIPARSVDSAIASLALSDNSFASHVIRSPIPAIVHFTQDSQYDKTMTRTISEVAPEFAEGVTVGVINITTSPINNELTSVKQQTRYNVPLWWEEASD